MDCDKARMLLSGYLDGELDVADNARIESHLRACRDCAHAYREQSLLSAAVREQAAALPDLSTLRARIDASLPRDAPAARGARRIWPRTGLAAAMAGAVGVTWALTFFLTRVPAEERLTDVAVSAHMRSTMGNHLTDIASSDPQQVAAWLQRQMQLAPPVRDLSAQGYELVGGRLDYVYKWQAGAIVYRRADHLINVFVWPAAATEFPRRVVSDEGFQVVFWTQQNLNFCAISDLGSEELVHFMRAYAS